MKDVGIQNARVCRCVPVSDPAARAREDHSLPRQGHRQWGGEGLKGRQLEYVRRTVCGACASASVYQRFAFAFVSIHGSDSATALKRVRINVIPSTPGLSYILRPAIAAYTSLFHP